MDAPDFLFCEHTVKNNGAVYDSSTKNGKVTYETLGFLQSTNGYIETPEGRMQIAFLTLKEFELELIQPVGKEREIMHSRKSGVIDHVAFWVSDIQLAFADAKKEGYKMLDVMLRELPIFESGVKYFKIEGPDGEHIEFTKKNY